MRGRQRESWVGGSAFARIAALAVPLAVSAFACGSVDDTISPAHDAGTFEVAPPLHGNTACGTCLASACANQRRGCAAEPTCTKYLACAEACPAAPSGDVDLACEAACLRPSDPAGATAFGALAACRTRGAGSRCTACSGGSTRYRSPLLAQVCGAAPVPTPLPPICAGENAAAIERCAKCRIERCCETGAACDASTRCVTLRDCLQACPTPSPDAYRQCFFTHPDGVPSYARNFSCAVVRCRAECVADSPCDACRAGYCGDEYAAMTATAETYLYRLCLSGCPEEDGGACARRCAETYPAGPLAESDFDLCDRRFCVEACIR